MLENNATGTVVGRAKIFGHREGRHGSTTLAQILVFGRYERRSPRAKNEDVQNYQRCPICFFLDELRANTK